MSRSISHILSLLILSTAFLPGPVHAAPSIVFVSSQFIYLDEYDVSADLRQAGFEVGTLHWKAITADSLKPFNVVVLTDIPGADEKGRLPAKITEACEALHAYCRAGGGILASMGMGGWDKGRVAANIFLKSWDAELLDEQVTDPGHLYRQTRGIRWRYSWTTQLSPSQVTKGVKTVFYPAQSWRADGQKTLYAPKFGKAWQVVVRGEKSAMSVRTKAGAMGKVAATYKTDPPIAGIRAAGSGRAAVLALWPNWTFWGARRPAMEGIVWERGAVGEKSDTGKLCLQLLKWLSEPSAKSRAFGGYVTPENPATRPEKYPGREVNWAAEKFPAPPTWKHFKVLAGARTGKSGGEGSVADYVASAKKAGYQAVLFAERLDQLTPEEWNQLRKECEDATEPDFLALPGIDFTTLQGDEYVAFGEFDFPKPPGLAPDGKHIDDTYNFWGSQMHHGFIAISRLNAHPNRDPQMLKNMPACAVYTYQNGKLVDDSLGHYLALNAQFHNLVPLALHLVDSPEAVAKAAAAEWQNVWRVNSASDLKEQITPHSQAGLLYWFNPHRAYLTGGPVLEEWSGLNVMYWGSPTKDSDRWKLRFNVSSPAGISEVKVFDREDLYLRFVNEGKNCEREIPGHHDRQHVFHVLARDGKGRQLLSPGIRIRFSQAYVNQCGDHQNSISATLQRNRKGRMIYTWGTTLGVYAGWIPTWNAPCPVDPGDAYPPSWDGGHTGSAGKAGVTVLVDGGNREGGEESAASNLYEVAGPEIQILNQVVRFKYPKGTPPRRDTAPTYRTIPTEYLDYTVRRVTPTAGFGRAGISFNEILVTAKRDFEFDAKRDVPLHGYAFSDYGSRPEGVGDHFFMSFADGRSLNRVGPRGAHPRSTPGEMKVGNYYAAYPNPYGAGAVFPLNTVRARVTITGTLGGATFGLSLKGKASKGDSWKMRFLAASASTSIEDGNQVFDDIRRTLGVGCSPAYEIQASRGTVEETTGHLLAAASSGVFSARLTRTRMPADLLIQVKGLTNGWTTAKQVNRGPLQVVTLHRGTAYTNVNLNDRDIALTVGHPVTCTSSEVRVVAWWSKAGVDVYAHNPTPNPIDATYRTNPAFHGLPNGEKSVTVSGGASLSFTFR